MSIPTIESNFGFLGKFVFCKNLVLVPNLFFSSPIITGWESIFFHVIKKFVKEVVKACNAFLKLLQEHYTVIGELRISFI